MKRMISLLLALALSLGLGATTLAEGDAQAPPSPAKTVLSDGPLALGEAMDPEALLTASIALTYGSPGTTIALQIAAERGAEAGQMGALRQLVASAAEENTLIESLRYAAAMAEDGRSMAVKLVLDFTANGSMLQVQDTLTLRPDDWGGASLTVESTQGGVATGG